MNDRQGTVHFFNLVTARFRAVLEGTTQLNITASDVPYLTLRMHTVHIRTVQFGNEVSLRTRTTDQLPVVATLVPVNTWTSRFDGLMNLVFLAQTCHRNFLVNIVRIPHRMQNCSCGHHVWRLMGKISDQIGSTIMAETLPCAISRHS